MKVARRSRGKRLAAVDDEPELMPGLDLYWDAYWALDTCRPSGFGFAKIPWSVASQYATEHDFDGVQRQTLYAAIRAMDGEYGAWVQRKAETERKFKDAQRKANGGA